MRLWCLLGPQGGESDGELSAQMGGGGRVCSWPAVVCTGKSRGLRRVQVTWVLLRLEQQCKPQGSLRLELPKKSRSPASPETLLSQTLAVAFLVHVVRAFLVHVVLSLILQCRASLLSRREAPRRHSP